MTRYVMDNASWGGVIVANRHGLKTQYLTPLARYFSALRICQAALIRASLG